MHLLVGIYIFVTVIYFLYSHLLHWLKGYNTSLIVQIFMVGNISLYAALIPFLLNEIHPSQIEIVWEMFVLM